MSSGIPLSTLIALLGLLISLLSLYLNNRFKLIEIINSKLSEMARECDVDVDFEVRKDIDGKSIQASLEMLEIPQHISHTVSTIVSAKQLLKRTIKSNKLFFLEIAEQACIDKFYFQLHTSVREFIMNAERHTIYVNKQLDVVDHEYHRILQAKYCRDWLMKSYNKYGNATPPVILNRLDTFKKIKSEEKQNGLSRLAAEK